MSRSGQLSVRKLLQLVGKAVGVALEVYGALWFLTKVVEAFDERAATTIHSYWWTFVLAGIGLCLYRFWPIIWPRRRYTFKVANRDVSVEIVIGDIFHEDGDLIVGANTELQVSSNVINPSSIQGTFTARYVDNVEDLKAQIDEQLGNKPMPYGTTVTVRGFRRTRKWYRLKRSTEDKIAYFCAIAELNRDGVAGTRMEKLRLALGELWNYIAKSGEKGTLNVPLLGTGFGRIGETRQVVAKEIIASFLAALSESTFCDRLRVVIHKSDIEKYSIDVAELVGFAEYNCKYAIALASEGGAGTPE